MQGEKQQIRVTVSRRNACVAWPHCLPRCRQIEEDRVGCIGKTEAILADVAVVQHDDFVHAMRCELSSCLVSTRLVELEAPESTVVLRYVRVGIWSPSRAGIGRLGRRRNTFCFFTAFHINICGIFSIFQIAWLPSTSREIRLKVIRQTSPVARDLQPRYVAIGLRACWRRHRGVGAATVRAMK